ncbi:hypothetical protein KEJ50_07005 [Candidatus Bathyarchaeota archaeon]|nr:hypothetical protein [Candidatus Bathyarchaeota archaeon]
MEEILNIDKQGRVVLSTRIRKAIGIKGRGKLLARLDGSRIILELFPEDLNKRVEEWINLARNIKIEVFTEACEESWRWMSLEYAKRKLGLS